MREDESLERAIHEDVALCPYNPEWPFLFLAERERLFSLFPLLLLDIQHFGSTAIPGMSAKPIIDILAGVESMAVAESLVEPLLRSSYTTSAEFNATLTDRRWFMRWANGRRTHHLHVVVLGGTEWRQRLHFRDVLRSDPELANRYSLLKTELAVQHSTDREAYTRAKTEFVLSVARDA
ncbi:GrpB family protein [Thiobacillus thioparus]|uniref:GrpB family protein n=1 Tax=Thiobacillus thioparus TaxID=931 RepID=UPI00037C4F90|nr:GrpB family protein [Thiobacillus thioparus]